MTTLEKETCNCRIADKELNKEESREELCKKMCANILQGLLEGYEDLKQKNPEKLEEFQHKIEEIKEQMQANYINQQIEEIFTPQNKK
jgi:hypothetical protein